MQSSSGEETRHFILLSKTFHGVDVFGNSQPSFCSAGIFLLCARLAHGSFFAFHLGFRSLMISSPYIEVTSWLVSADDFSSRVARGANERVSAANE